MIKKLVGMVISALFIASSSALPGFAQAKPSTLDSPSLDLTTLDCRALLQMDGDDRTVTLAFYHGIISGKNNQMTVNRPTLATATDNVINYCIDHPKDTLLSVFQKYRPAPSEK